MKRIIIAALVIAATGFYIGYASKLLETTYYNNNQ